MFFIQNPYVWVADQDDVGKQASNFGARLRSHGCYVFPFIPVLSSTTTTTIPISSRPQTTSFVYTATHRSCLYYR